MSLLWNTLTGGLLQSTYSWMIFTLLSSVSSCSSAFSSSSFSSLVILKVPLLVFARNDVCIENECMKRKKFEKFFKLIKEREKTCQKRHVDVVHFHTASGQLHAFHRWVYQSLFGISALSSSLRWSCWGRWNHKNTINYV